MAFEVVLFPWQTVLFPGTIMPIRVTEGAHLEAVRHCLDTSTPFGVVLVELVGTGQGMLAEAGTLATITDHVKHEDGAIEALGVGGRRFRIREIVQEEPFLLAQVDAMEEQDSAELSPAEVDSIEELTEQFWRYANLALPKLSSSLRIHLPSDPLSRLNLICSALLVPFHQKQQLLEEDDLPRRVRVTYNILRRESAELQAFRAAMKVLRGDEDAPPGPGPFSLN